jgi:hypothetical protein
MMGETMPAGEGASVLATFPKRLAIVGLALGFLVVGCWWFDLAFNPFHLPAWPNVPKDYSEPPAHRILQDALLVFCPGSLLQIFTIGIGGWVSWCLWILAALLNVPIYYCVGLLVVSLTESATKAR